MINREHTGTEHIGAPTTYQFLFKVKGRCQAPWYIPVVVVIVGGGGEGVGAPSTDTPAHRPWTALCDRWQWTGQKSKVGVGVGRKMPCYVVPVDQF